mgnify:FL=1
MNITATQNCLCLNGLDPKCPKCYNILTMKFYRETTDWEVPNHTYLLTTDKSKMYGYIKLSSRENVVFAKPMKFDARGRTFVEVKELGDIDLDNLAPTERWEVAGSKGGTYIVERIDGTLRCSCPGYGFRGQCRHIEGIENAELV